MNILFISGSLAARSRNCAALEAMAAAAGEGTQIEWARIDDMPFYRTELDGETRPESVTRFRAAIERADGIVIATPEFNYSVPGVLKNALDWASRPAYRSPLAGKAVAILGASPSPVGTARAQGHLKQILLGMVAAPFPYPEVCLGGERSAIDEAGALVDPSTRDHLAAFFGAFSTWLAKSQDQQDRRQRQVQ